MLHQQLTHTRLSAKEIFDKAENEQDEAALETIRISAEKLGLTLALLVDLLALDCIVIGSIYSRSTAIINKTMIPTFESEILPINKGLCSIKPSLLMESLGDIAAVTVAQRGVKSKTHS